MSRFTLNAENLQALSRLFTYPETWPVTDIQRLALTAGEVTGGAAADDFNLTTLQNNYVRLFINTLPEVPCPPYGSFYLEGTLMGPSTIRLKKMYREYGFETDEIPDHIAVELEFLALLSTLSSHDLVREDYDFLLGHLRQWVPDFFKQVERSDDTGFYKEVSRYAKQVLF